MIKNIFLALGAIFIAFIVGEVAVRIFVEQETKRLAIYDPDIGWRGRPNGSGVYIRNRDNIKANFQFNQIGFRDETVGPKPALTKRILLLGDSFVESLEVEFDQTFHHILERSLKDSISANLEVNAVCSQGYSTSQEILAYKKFRDTIDPDFVFLCFYTGNDFQDNLRKTFAYLDKNDKLIFPPNSDSWIRIQFLSFQRWLYESSHLVFFIKNFLQSKANVRMEAAGKKVEKTSNERKYQVTKRLITACRDEVESDGTQFAVVILPNRKEIVERNYAEIRLIADHCEASSIPYLTVQDSLVEADFFKYDGHFTASGHDKVAELMFEFFATQFHAPAVGETLK